MIRVACSVQQFLSSEVMAAFTDIKADKLKCRQRLIHIGNLRGEKQEHQERKKKMNNKKN